MSVEAMKQALEALELVDKDIEWHPGSPTKKFCYKAILALRQAIDISQERVDETTKRKHKPVAWHEPGAYGNVTTHKDWALANGWEPLYKEKRNGNTS